MLLLREGFSEPESYGDLVYKFDKYRRNDVSIQKIIIRYRHIGYNLHVMLQSTCLVFNTIMVDNYAVFLNYTTVDRASVSMIAPTSWLRSELLVCCLAHRGLTCVFLRIWRPGICIVRKLTESVSPRF